MSRAVCAAACLTGQVAGGTLPGSACAFPGSGQWTLLGSFMPCHGAQGVFTQGAVQSTGFAVRRV
jgi:hypothetical protein